VTEDIVRAETAIRRLDDVPHLAGIETLSRLILRAESIASSQIEDLVVSLCPHPKPNHGEGTSFTSQRRGRSLRFQWRVPDPRSMVGFTLFAGAHRLDARVISVHAGPVYRYRVGRMLLGYNRLHVLLRDGGQEVLTAD